MVQFLVLVGCGAPEPVAAPPVPAPPAPSQRPDRRQGSGMGCDLTAMMVALKVSSMVDDAVRGTLQGSDPLCMGRFGRVVVAGANGARTPALMKFEGGAWRLVDLALNEETCADKTTLPSEVCQELAAAPTTQ